MFQKTFFLFGLVLLSACGADEKKEEIAIPIEEGPFVFNLTTMFSDAENWISFPVWFNDSVIREKKIKEIKRRIFHISINDLKDAEDLEDIPRESRVYHFDRNGQIKSLEIAYLFDDQEIGRVAYVFTPTDIPGYFQVKTLVGEQVNFDELIRELPFRQHNLIAHNAKGISFIEMETGNHLHCMTQKKYFGPLSVDSVFHPHPEDVILLGWPGKLQKKYSVVNKVHERNVHLYNYSKKGFPVAIKQSEFPFEMKRVVTYDQQSRCVGYIDSTFSEGAYLTAIISEFKLNEEGLPKKQNRFKESGSRKTRIAFEEYEYDFYKTRK
jgi:hypothetical protein